MTFFRFISAAAVYLALTFIFLNPAEFCAQTPQQSYDQDLPGKEFFRGRREALRALLPPKSVAVVFAAPVRNRSNDVDYEYHQDPDFYYLTGLDEPRALLLVFKEEFEIAGIRSDEFAFVDDRNPAEELWNGHRLGADGVRDLLGIKAVFVNLVLDTLTMWPDGLDKVFYTRPDGPILMYGNRDLFVQFYTKVRNLGEQRLDETGLKALTAALREVKQEEEIVLMRKAIAITCEAQKELMRSLRPGMTEYQAEAVIEFVFKHRGAEHPGFPSIVGGGENTCILHYITNRKKLAEGELLVADVGAEYHGYAADVTRTLPVSGRFTEEQRAIYDIVLEAQREGIRQCRSGAPFGAAHAAAVTIVQQRLLELGIIRQAGDYRRYFMHGTSHYLGLDVHDAGTHGSLKSGTVITVEPGIYIPAGSDCDPKWWNIGVRIEDDILITDGDPIVLSDRAPVTPEEIERLMAGESPLGTWGDE